MMCICLAQGVAPPHQPPRASRVGQRAVQGTGSIWCPIWSMALRDSLAACESPFLGTHFFGLLLQRQCLWFDLICSSPCRAAVVFPSVASLLSWPISVLCCESGEGESMNLISVLSLFCLLVPGTIILLLLVSVCGLHMNIFYVFIVFVCSSLQASHFHFQLGFILVPDIRAGVPGNGTGDWLPNAFSIPATPCRHP